MSQSPMLRCHRSLDGDSGAIAASKSRQPNGQPRAALNINHLNTITV